MEKTKILIILFTALSFSNANAQKLIGTYKNVFYSRQLTFKNNRFEDRYRGDIGGKYGQGTFSLKKGKLSLKYEFLYKSRDTSKYVMTYRPEALPYTLLDVSAFAEDKAPIKVTLTLRNSTGMPMVSFDSDEKGLGLIILKEAGLFDFLSIESLGYNMAIIPLNKLKLLQYKIRADMISYSTYYIEPGIVDYKVLKMSPDSLVLKSESDDFEHYFLKVK